MKLSQWQCTRYFCRFVERSRTSPSLFGVKLRCYLNSGQHLRSSKPPSQSRHVELLYIQSGHHVICDVDAITDRPIGLQTAFQETSAGSAHADEARNHTRKGRSRHSQKKLLSSSQTLHRPVGSFSAGNREHVVPEQDFVAPLAGSRTCSRAIRGS